MLALICSVYSGQWVRFSVLCKDLFYLLIFNSIDSGAGLRVRDARSLGLGTLISSDPRIRYSGYLWLFEPDSGNLFAHSHNVHWLLHAECGIAALV